MGDDSDLAGMLTDHEACDDVIRGSLEFDSFGLTPPVPCIHLNTAPTLQSIGHA